MANLTLHEQETHFNMTADDRNTWHVYSDDVVMQRRLESIGAKLVRLAPDGIGMHYELPANQVTLRKPSKPLSEARKAQLAARMRALHSETQITGAK